MLGTSKWLACASLTAIALASPALAAPAKGTSQKAPTNAELLERIEKLEQQQTKSKDTIDKQRNRITVLEEKTSDPVISFADSRPTFTSVDKRFSLALRARFQFDYAHFMQSDGATKNIAGAPAGFFDRGSGTNIRRSYFGIEGKAFNDFWYEFRLDLGGSDENTGVTLSRARVAYHGIDNFRINVGVIQPMMNYADSVSSGDLTFIERPAISNVLVDNFGGSGNRKGVELTFQKESILRGGDNLIASVAYTGARTGVNAADSGHVLGGDEDSNLVGKIEYRVFSNENTNIQLGVHGGRIMNHAGLPAASRGIRLRDRPEIRVTGDRLVDTGGTLAGLPLDSATAYGYEFAANWRNFYVAAEYDKYEIDFGNTANNPGFSGWYVEGTWMITGESRRYNKNSMSNNYGSFGPPKVVKPFSLKGGSWGAWELAARYSTLDLNWNENVAGSTTIGGIAYPNGIAGGEQSIITLGVNWYLNNNVKLVFNDLIVNVDRQSAAGAANNFLGQNFNVVAGRMQFSM